MKIVVLGAGAWGTALAVGASQNPRGHQVSLWSRKSEHQRLLQSQRENHRYLPGFALPEALAVLQCDAQALQAHLTHQDLVIVATPMAGLRGVLSDLANLTVPLAWLCKGFELARDRRLTVAALLLSSSHND